MNEIQIEIINKVREKVKEHKLNTGETQVKLAARIGIEKQSLNGAFNAKKVPDLDTLAKLSIAMGCQITDLFEIRKISC